MDLTADVEIVFRTGGPTVRHDPRRFRAALSDVLAERAASTKPQQAALTAAVEAGAAIGLIRDSSAEQQRRWIEALNRDFSLTPEMATWAVNTIRDGAIRAGISQGTESSTPDAPRPPRNFPTRAVLGALAAVVVVAAAVLFFVIRSDGDDGSNADDAAEVDDSTAVDDAAVADATTAVDDAAVADSARVTTVSATKSSTQEIQSGTATAITFPDTEDWDVDDLHNPGRDPSRITVPEGMAGVWRFSYTMYFGVSAQGTGTRSTWMSPNGDQPTTRYGWSKMSIASPGSDHAIAGSADIVLGVGDFVEVYAFQDSGAPITVGLAGFPVRFQGTFLGPAG